MGSRADKAKEMFYEGYNCCQSVVGAFADAFGFDPKTAMQTVEGLGGGMGRMRLTCGAVSAMAVIAGMKQSTGLPGDLKRRGEIYALIQDMCARFREKNGSLICAELLGIKKPDINRSGTSNEAYSPVPEARTPEYYKKRPCPQCIYDCALIIEEYLLNGSL